MQQLISWSDLALIGCCLVSLRFLCGSLSGRPVVDWLMDSEGEKLVGLLTAPAPEIDPAAMTNYSLGAREGGRALFLDKGEGDEMTKTEMEDPKLLLQCVHAEKEACFQFPLLNNTRSLAITPDDGATAINRDSWPDASSSSSTSPMIITW